MRYIERPVPATLATYKEAIIMFLKEYRQRCLEQATIGQETPGDLVYPIMGDPVNKETWLKEVADEIKEIDEILGKIE